MTIKEVAELAGVSPAAVSRYLNGGSLSEEKRTRIRQAIEETGYRPNSMAQLMRTGRSGQIGVIVPKIYSDSVSQILAGISDQLTDRNYLTMLGSTDGKNEQVLNYLSVMLNNQVAGIILMASEVTPILEDAIRASDRPVVITGQNFQGFPCVYHDDFNAVKELTTRMLNRGRKNIAYIGVTDDDPAAGRSRRLGAEEAYKAQGRDPGELLRLVSAFSSEGGRDCMKQILRLHPEVDGVICATDTIALGAMDAIRTAGKKIPEQIAVAGVGDCWADGFTQPSLTTAHLYYRQCGQAAADMLLKLIENQDEDMPVQQTMLEYTIVERQSM